MGSGGLRWGSHLRPVLSSRLDAVLLLGQVDVPHALVEAIDGSFGEPLGGEQVGVIPFSRRSQMA